MADAPKPAPKPDAKYEPPKELPQAAAVQKFQGRPKRQPVEQAEYFYNVKGTHIAFFLSSLGMLISFLMMFHKDVDRPWKPYQVQFKLRRSFADSVVTQVAGLTEFKLDKVGDRTFTLTTNSAREMGWLLDAVEEIVIR